MHPCEAMSLCEAASGCTKEPGRKGTLHLQCCTGSLSLQGSALNLDRDPHNATPGGVNALWCCYWRYACHPSQRPYCLNLYRLQQSSNVLPQVVSLLCGVVFGATLATPLNTLIVWSFTDSLPIWVCLFLLLGVVSFSWAALATA